MNLKSIEEVVDSVVALDGRKAIVKAVLREDRQHLIQTIREEVGGIEECASGCGCSKTESYHPGGECVWQKVENISKEYILTILTTIEEEVSK